jgi:hypothetical protein
VHCGVFRWRFRWYVLLPLLYFAIRGRRYGSVALWLGSVVLAVTIPKVSARLDVFLFGPCFTSGC